ncbi:MAG: hypothetical protein D6701_00115 [Gemmatimonadetes bacterium]|nr:MAG: hypothetical protein D6701_00115 [Gemmatimonadota bacterium]
MPVGTLAIGKAGATNAAILATQIVAARYPEYREAVREYRRQRTEAVLAVGDPRDHASD